MIRINGQRLKPVLDRRYTQSMAIILLCWLAGNFMACSLWPEGSGVLFWLLWSIGLGTFSITLLLQKHRRSLIVLAFFFTAFLLGGLYSQLWLTGFGSKMLPQHYTAQPEKLDIQLERPWGKPSDPKTQATTRWVARIQKQPSTYVLLKVPAYAFSKTDPLKNKPLEAGQTFTAIGVLEKPDDAAFPGGFSYRTYLQQHHIRYLMTPTFIEAAPPKPFAFLRAPYFGLLNLAAHARSTISQQFERTLGPDHGNLLASIVLGEHATALDEDIRDQFRHTGLAHLLAASGLNVGIIAAVMLLLGRFFKLPLRLNLIVAMLTVALYALVTGLPPSVQRASMMLEIGLALKCINRHLSALLLLCLAGVILTLFNPFICLQVGFQLSLLSTLGLVTMTRPVARWLGYWLTPWLGNLIAVPLIAQLWVLPIQWSIFHEMSLVALPANLLAMPLVGVLTTVGFIASLLSLILPFAASLVLWLAAPFLWALLGLTRLFDALPFASTSFGLSNPAWAMMLYLLLASAVLGYRRLRRQLTEQLSPQPLPKKLMVISGLGCLVFSLFALPASLEKARQAQPHAAVLSSPHGQANLVFSHHGQHSVVVQDTDWKSLYALKDYLKQHQATQLDLFLWAPAPSARRPWGKAVKELVETLHVDNALLAADQQTASYLNALSAKRVTTFPNEQLPSFRLSGNETHRDKNKALSLWLRGHPNMPERAIGVLAGKQPLVISAGSKDTPLSVTQLQLSPNGIKRLPATETPDTRRYPYYAKLTW